MNAIANIKEWVIPLCFGFTASQSIITVIENRKVMIMDIAKLKYFCVIGCMKRNERAKTRKYINCEILLLGWSMSGSIEHRATKMNELIVNELKAIRSIEPSPAPIIKCSG